MISIIETRDDGKVKKACNKCGLRTNWMPENNELLHSCESKVSREPPTPEEKEKLLGDRVEELLASWNVTPETYKLAKAWLLQQEPKDVDCKCAERKKFLNRLHERYLAFVRGGQTLNQIE